MLKYVTILLSSKAQRVFYSSRCDVICRLSAVYGTAILVSSACHIVKYLMSIVYANKQ